MTDVQRALIGRGAEVAELVARIDGARRGTSSALCLSGEAGIGKTELLDRAGSAATGFTLLRAQGTPTESTLAFAGLSQLLHPVRHHIDDLPATPAAALRAALGGGRPADGDRFTPQVGLLALLSAAAEVRPLLVLVDDAQWWDVASTEALVFACRRTRADRAAILVTTRPVGEGALSALPVMEVRGLDAPASAALLAAHSRAAVDPDVARRVHEGTRGNPLALVELARRLTSAQLSGAAPLDDPLPVGPSLERAYREQIRRLPAATRKALLLAAAGSASDATVTGEPDRNIAALEPAEEAGLVTVIDGRVAFRHPLIRAACYHGATAAARRAAHRTLAASSAPDAAAWHLAAATTGPDEQVATTLEHAAVRARDRNAHDEAARAFERAARRSPPAAVAGRMFDAARELRLCGRTEAALKLLDEAGLHTRDPGLLAEIHRLRAQIDMWRGHPLRMHDLLTAEAARVASADPARAGRLYLEAVFPCVLGNDHANGMAAARSAERLIGAEHPLVAHALATLLTQERRYRQARPLLLHATEYLEQADPIATQEIVGTTALCLGLQGDVERGLRLLGRLVTAARARVMPGILPLALSMASLLEFWAGRWQQSWANGTESVRLAEETGQATDSPLAFGLYVQAGMGRVAECRDHAKQVTESVARTGNLGVASWMHAAIGKLELALRDDDAAVRELLESHRTIPPDTQVVPEWTADLAEALVRSGSPGDAIIHCDELARWAQDNQNSVGMALATRTKILLEPDGAQHWHQEAMTWFQRADRPFDRARADLYYGEHLRRTRRLTDARRHLDRARDQFRRLGAEPWTRRATGELRASGAAVPDLDVTTVARLTSQEMQIALAVSGGATNREVAAVLLLSPRTVGFHLSNIYRKLGIRSRIELARVLAEPQAGATVTADP